MQADREINFVIGGQPVDLENVATPSSRKIAVYTAIFSDYDEPPALQVIDGDIDYFLFTDGSVENAPEPWQIRIIDPVFFDPQRDARRVKVLPHLFLPKQYEISVWVDSSLSMKQLTAAAIETLLAGADIAVTRHNMRTCIYDEAKAVLDVKYETASRVERQIARYRAMGFPEYFGLHATMFLVRRHLSEAGMAFNLEWWSELSRFSKRDQLSFDYVRWRHPGIKVNTLQMEVRYNPVFGFKLSGRDHKSSSRVIDEHLHVALRTSDGGKAPLLRYDDLYDLLTPDFLAHLRNLRKITAAISEMPYVDALLDVDARGMPYSPPDPRKGMEREIFIRALAGRTRLLDMQFGNGGRAALALSQTSLSVSALGTEGAAYAEPCAGYLGVYFGERLDYRSLDPETLSENLGDVSYDTIDAIHIDGNAEADVIAACLDNVATYARPGTVLILTAAGNPHLVGKLSTLCDQGALIPYGDLHSADQSAFIITSNLAAAEMAAPLFEPSIA
ncbi:MAG: DUF616 domain-containing protein [Neorhizobium sp.]|nr:DUF616 domain-containing protein [Neorhizobium sp.]